MTERLTAAQRGYDGRWQRKSKAFLRRNPLCVPCRKRGRTRIATTVDHIVPHRLGQAKQSGDPVAIAKAQRLFWAEDNWESSCKPCHDSVKQALEKGGSIKGCGVDGMPVDPNHPWNQEARTCEP